MRRSKVMGFSVPPELHRQFERILKTKHKTRSEFFREILDAYFAGSHAAPDEIDLAHALRSYWDLRGRAAGKVIVIGLGIIAREGKVLIGARKMKDRWVENLSWVFPGGRLTTLDFAAEVGNLVRKETGIPVEVRSLIAARVHPDTGFKDTQVVALYFHCEPVGDAAGRAGNGLARLKWVRPSDVFKYFTTSVTDDVTTFLLALEKAT